VVDGQHRKLAADLRSDVTTLPCHVLQAGSVKDEAMAFLVMHTGKVGVAGLDRSRALLRTGDASAECNINITNEAQARALAPCV